jgi:hypothetical protein
MQPVPLQASAPARKRPVLAIAIVAFAAGGGLGFMAGVLSVKGARDFATSMVRSERPATVGQPITVDRPQFRFQHPGNWTVDTKANDYDPDHLFSVDSPGHSFALFIVAEGDLSPKVSVDAQVAAQTAKVIKGATQTALTQWGSHTGEGVLLTGKQLGITPGTILVFAFRENDSTYTVVASTFDEDRASVQPGFDLIARTFRVKDRPE